MTAALAWTDRAACLGDDPRTWDAPETARIVEPTDDQLAACRRCPALTDCARDALDAGAAWTVRAGVVCDRRTAERSRRTDDRLRLIADGHVT